MSSPKTLFVSHSHADAAMASAFATWLEDAFDSPVTVILTSRPKDHIDAGAITQELLKRLRRSEVALAFLTPHAMASPWVYYEMGAAQALEVVFIPCTTAGLSLRDLPPQAYEYQGADLQRQDDVQRLMESLSKLLESSVRRSLDVARLVATIEASTPKGAPTVDPRTDPFHVDRSKA